MTAFATLPVAGSTRRMRRTFPEIFSATACLARTIILSGILPPLISDDWARRIAGAERRWLVFLRSARRAEGGDGLKEKTQPCGLGLVAFKLIAFVKVLEAAKAGLQDGERFVGPRIVRCVSTEF